MGPEAELGPICPSSSTEATPHNVETTVKEPNSGLVEIQFTEADLEDDDDGICIPTEIDDPCYNRNLTALDGGDKDDDDDHDNDGSGGSAAELKITADAKSETGDNTDEKISSL